MNQVTICKRVCACVGVCVCVCVRACVCVCVSIRQKFKLTSYKCVLQTCHHCHLYHQWQTCHMWHQCHQYHLTLSAISLHSTLGRLITDNTITVGRNKVSWISWMLSGQFAPHCTLTHPVSIYYSWTKQHSLPRWCHCNIIAKQYYVQP